MARRFLAWMGDDRDEGVVLDPFDIAARAFAEFVGTFALLFIGVGTVAALTIGTEPSVVPIALAHGLTIAIMVSAVGHISGGHFNPAVTIAFFVTRRLAPLVAIVYLVVQLAAAVAAVGLLRWVFPSEAIEGVRYGTPSLNPEIDVAQGLVVEAVLTFFLVWVVFATAADDRGTFKSIAGLAIGLTITVGVLVADSLTGAAMNPARAFGPQVIDGSWNDAWIWYVGPILGGAIAALVYELLYLRPTSPPPVGPPDTGVVEPRPGDTAVS